MPIVVLIDVIAKIQDCVEGIKSNNENVSFFIAQSAGTVEYTNCFSAEG